MSVFGYYLEHETPFLQVYYYIDELLYLPRRFHDKDIILRYYCFIFRRSDLDWSNLDVAKEAGFGKAKAIETILRQGEVLYIPSFWFHYIVSLQYSIQCNSRSGSPDDMKGEPDILKCYDENPRGFN